MQVLVDTRLGQFVKELNERLVQASAAGLQTASECFALRSDGFTNTCGCVV